MTEIRDGKRVIIMPVSDEDLSALKAGDVFYYEGEALTGRDAAHERALSEGCEFPVDMHGMALYHAGPIMKENEDGSFRVVSIGPTTSARMEAYEYDFIEKTGARIIIGKGGMGERTEEACRKFKAVQCIFPAGNAVIAAECTEEVIGVYWEDLGMPEACWHLRLKEFGPLIVAIDTEGRNLMKEKMRTYEENKDAVTEELHKL